MICQCQKRRLYFFGASIKAVSFKIFVFTSTKGDPPRYKNQDGGGPSLHRPSHKYYISQTFAFDSVPDTPDNFTKLLFFALLKVERQKFFS